MTKSILGIGFGAALLAMPAHAQWTNRTIGPLNYNPNLLNEQQQYQDRQRQLELRQQQLDELRRLRNQTCYTNCSQYGGQQTCTTTCY